MGSLGCIVGPDLIPSFVPLPPRADTVV